MTQPPSRYPLRSTAHHCPDWDFLYINPSDAEMECCTCVAGIEERPAAAALGDDAGGNEGTQPR